MTTETTTTRERLIADYRRSCRNGYEPSPVQLANWVALVLNGERDALGRTVTVRLRPEPGQLAKKVTVTGRVVECRYERVKPAGRSILAVFRVRLDNGRTVYLTTV